MPEYIRQANGSIDKAIFMLGLPQLPADRRDYWQRVLNIAMAKVNWMQSCSSPVQLR